MSPPGRRDPRHQHSPRVRRLAREHGIDASALTGTGPGGRVTPHDVLTAATGYPARQRAGHSAVLPRPVPGRTQVIEADLTRVMAQAAVMTGGPGQQTQGLPATTPFLAKAVLESLVSYPSLNASVPSDGGPLRHGQPDLGVAIEAPGGRVFCVLADAGALNLAGVSRRLRDLAARAALRQVEPPEPAIAGLTIIDNAGRGIILDAPALDGAQVAVLSAGSPVKRPVVVHGEDGEPAIAIRPTVYLALTYDQQLISSADAGEFLATVKARLEAGRFM